MTSASRRAPSVSILIPAKDEQEAIAEVLGELPVDTLRDAGHEVEVLVVDGRSTDDTRRIARAHGARVLVQPGKGKGRAVRAALHAAEGDIVIMLDADRTYPAERIPRFVAEVRAGAEVVMGTRLEGHLEPGSMSPVNHFGNRCLSAIASLLYGGHVSDVCTGMWAFRRDAVVSLPLDSTHFEIEAELYAESRKAGLKIVEVPITYRRRLGDTKLGSIRDGIRIGFTLVQKRVSRRGTTGPAGSPSRA